MQRLQPTVTVTSLEHDLGVGVDHPELVRPDRPVRTYVAKVPPVTDMVTGKSDHAPSSKRCTWRIAPSPPG